MEPDFCEFVENLYGDNRFGWLNNGYFRNPFKCLYKLYIANVKNNFVTHKKRARAIFNKARLVVQPFKWCYAF